MNGNSVNISVYWVEILYKIMIIESGLKNGSEWSVTLSGYTFNGQYINVTMKSENNTMVFSEPNGTYKFFVRSVGGFLAIPSNGNIYVSGSSIVKRIVFLIEYKITFLAQGLPSNVSWYVIINGNNISSNSDKIEISETNGNYSFSVVSPIYINSNMRFVANRTTGTIYSTTFQFMVTLRTEETLHLQAVGLMAVLI